MTSPTSAEFSVPFFANSVYDLAVYAVVSICTSPGTGRHCKKFLRKRHVRHAQHQEAVRTWRLQDIFALTMAIACQQRG